MENCDKESSTITELAGILARFRCEHGAHVVSEAIQYEAKIAKTSLIVWLVIKMYSSADKFEGEPLGLFSYKDWAEDYASKERRTTSLPIKVWPFEVDLEMDS